MKRLAVDPHHPSGEALASAVAVLRGGGLVAFPTETVYGLGARALDDAAVRRIFAAKGRPGWNPVIAHVTDAAMARRDVVARWTAEAEALAAAFWPGPLTLVLPKQDPVPAAVTAGLPSVGVRAPAHPVAQALLRALDEPIAAPSANRFTAISPTTADHVVKSLNDAVDVVLDGGPATVGVESTVVDLTGATPRILRPGGVTRADLQRALPGIPIAVGPAVADGVARASPGQVRRHYAPRADVLLLPHADSATLAEAQRDATPPIGALTFTLTAPVAHALRLPNEPARAQAELYAALHRLEDAGCATILLELPPPGPSWDALRDRLTRAAG